MGLIQVTSAELRKQAEQLKSLNGSFKNNIGTLESTELSLKSMWEGQANTAFHNAFIKDKGQMDNFNNLIEQYIQALLEIAAKYEAAEAKNTDTATTRSY